MTSSSLKAPFQGIPSPFSFLVRSPISTVYPCIGSTNTPLAAFDHRLARDLLRFTSFDQWWVSELRHFIYSDEEYPYLSETLLDVAVDVVCLTAYYNAEDLFPPHIRQAIDIPEGYSKWVNNYLVDTDSLLGVCNVIKNRIASIAHCEQLIQIGIHYFDKMESTIEIQFMNARIALANCLSVMKVEQRSELQKCKSLLKRLRQPPADAPWCESSSTIAQFAQVMNMCKENAVFVCGAVVDGLSFESKKRSFPLLANYIAQSGSSSSAFFHVHRGLKVEMENIKTKRTSALLLEMGMADKAARSLYRLLDRFLKRKTFSLSKDAAFQLRQKISILKKKAYNLKAVMDTLDKQMSKLSRSISTCGLTLSDMFTQKRYKEQDSSQ